MQEIGGIIILNIYTTIHSDLEGNYKTKDIISQLVKANLDIELPNKPLEKMCLADLKCKGLPCTYSHTEGIIWNNKLRIYTERKITLCFG